VLALGAVAFARLRADAAPAGGSALPADPVEVLTLWPGIPPGGHDVRPSPKVSELSPNPLAFHYRLFSDIGMPTLTVFYPEKPDGSAVLVIPGGSYSVVVFDNEGLDVARRLSASGVTCFVLQYRLPAEGWTNAADVPLQDVQRAMRIIRAGASRFKIDRARVGVLGFSAGGHIAASLATRFDASVYPHLDHTDDQDARPAFAGLMYPVITMFEGTHADSRRNLLGAAPTPDRLDAYSCERLVTGRTPPSFICLTADDDIVPYVPNGLAMFASLRAAKVAAELHVFQEGGHGFGIRGAAGKSPAVWPDLFLHWGFRNGWFRDSSAQPV
jgi:acetyl esterase/lipase